MSAPLHLLARLGVTPDADAREIRRAYARELKQIDQEADPAGFQSLREAYDEVLFWERHRDSAPSEESARPDPEPDAGGTVQEPPPRHAPEPAEPENARQPAPQDDQHALAAAVFGDFMLRRAALVAERATSSSAPWQDELRASLDDARLINIVARELFELHVAVLLAEGWRPGNEALLPAAVKVFNWAGDRRRVQALGQAGAMIDNAIDERAMFETQEDTGRQQRLIERLRDPRPPTARELVTQTVLMETMITRFPTWLALIVSVENVVRWRDMDRALPGWRRMLTFTGLGNKPSHPEERRGWSFNWRWIIFIAVLSMGRMACQERGHGADPGAGPHARDSYASVIVTADKLFAAGDFDGAAASYTRAIQLDAGKSYAYSSRALLYLESGGGDDDKILADLDKAGELDKKNANVPRGRGLLAMKHGRDQEAITEFTRSLQLAPNYPYTLDRRAEVYARGGQMDQALADIDLRLKTQPGTSIYAYETRIRIHLMRGDRAEAMEQIEAMINANHDNPNAYSFAASLLEVINQPEQAVAILDRGIAAAPTGALYLWRATLRPKTDIAGRRADIQYAVALAPATLRLLQARVALEIDDGKLDAAEKILSDEINTGKAAYADQPIMLAYRAIVHGKMGKPALADADLKAARAAAGTRLTLNNLAWFLAQQQTALPQALSAVNAALDQQPGDAAYLDTKGMILLQMGRHRASLEAYDAALKLRPGMASSLFGRGIARLRSGDKDGGAADLRAARQEYPGVDREYADYGVKP
jgi:tetratricopeptide (TPR) repeat protein